MKGKYYIPVVGLVNDVKIKSVKGSKISNTATTIYLQSDCEPRKSSAVKIGNKLVQKNKKAGKNESQLLGLYRWSE